MPSPANVIKRDGRRPTEPFDTEKLRASVRAACLSVRSPEGEAEMTASSVCDAVIRWSAQKTEITSADVRRIAAEFLEKNNPEAAYLYKHHRFVL